MEMRQLKMFCAVAECGSFTAAAEKIHTVQSNITMRIKELESELGQPLFVRKKSGIVLTLAGQTFQGYARRILQLTEESRSALLASAAPAGPLRLGSMETTAAVRLPPVLTRFREKCPAVRLSLATDTTAALIKAVEDYRLDGAFIGGLQRNTALVQEEMFQEELVLASSRDYTSLAELSRAMPKQTVLVFRTGCFYRSTLEHWFYQTGLAPNDVMEMGTLDGILSCVASGMGVTLLPRTVIERSHLRSALSIHRIPAEIANVKTVFIRRNDVLPSSAMAAFIALSHERWAWEFDGGPDAMRSPAQPEAIALSAADSSLH
ncbi:MAG: LysR family transcriptional regulator [Burkholderiales bacterium]|nr:LysR family transcriptional regulator [Burkholderiales bacterium]